MNSPRATSRGRRSAWILASAISLVAALGEPLAGAATLHVNASAPPGGDGSRERPLRSVQEAIRRSLDGDTVLVAAGEYRENLDLLGRRIAVRACDGPDSTRLDGDRLGPVVTIRRGEGPETTLEGFTITGGAGETVVGNRTGGGVLVEDASPTLIENRILRNGADLGGGLACLGGSPSLIRCEIASNQALIAAGGLYLVDSDARLLDCLFDSNRAVGGRGLATGGGILVVGGAPEIDGGRVSGNSAENGDGGGIAVTGESRLIVRACEIRGNDAPNGIGGGIVCLPRTLLWIGDCAVVANVAAAGGGIACLSASLGMVSTRVVDNSAVERLEGRRLGGGGIGLFDGSAASLDGCTIEGNVAAFINGLRAVRGGGVATTLSTVELVSCNVIGNRTEPGDGGGLACDGGEVAMDRCRFLGNEARDSPLVSSPSGGALVLRDATARITGTEIDANASHGAKSRGGGIASFGSSIECAATRISGNRTGGSGGGASLDGGAARLLHATIASNDAGRAGSALDGGGRVAIERSIVVRAARATAVAARPGPARASLLGPRLAELGALRIEDSIVEGGYAAGLRVVDLANPGFVNVERGDYHLGLGSCAVDALEPYPDPLLDGGDVDGDAWGEDGDLDGEPAADYGADELVPAVAVRYGSVGASSGSIETVLTVNGSVGDRRREVRLPVLSPIRVEMEAASAGPRPGPFVLYAWVEEPDPQTLSALPRGLGWIGHPTPLRPGNTGDPIRIWNNVGHPSRLGIPTHRSTPAPSRVLDRPRGLSYRTKVTFQGILLDRASTAEVPASVTNAVVLRIEDRSG